MPEVICSLKNLGASLDLSVNELSGSVPPCLGNVTSSRKLNLAYLQAWGAFNISLQFNISSNLLSGKNHAVIGNLRSALLIDLSMLYFCKYNSSEEDGYHTSMSSFSINFRVYMLKFFN
ncbi:hypothetical protein MTR67_050930 [Solanum verrucosum]|uniref:Non-specific serine/threonine protein kinase n=1 Tax=Solanum verrucosum TaxID=315347 RepID=A0AAF1A1Z4_SOLVR|nr:hypothetical protein MTR67_050930 [Solanum verrucosum]